jgi:DNA modification methylase
MTLGTARVIRGNALALPLDDETVDLIVTSPPYFGLRSYQDGGQHYDGQIGAEATPAEFVDALIAATREMARVLKPSGSIWVNLGDKYAGSGPGGPQNGSRQAEKTLRKGKQGRLPVTDVPAKSLIGIPWRYALRAIDDLGLILRRDQIWSKPNGLPESVTDRCRSSHEYWFHFVKQSRYYSAVDEIREPSVTGDRVMFQSTRGKSRGMPPRGPSDLDSRLLANNPLGKLPGSVWEIPTQPLTVPDHLGVDHYAAFPMEWPRRIIAGWSPPGICTACGQGRRPISIGQSYPTQGPNIAMKHNADRADGGGSSGRLATVRTITGYACACPAPTIDVEVTEFDYDLGETVTRIAQRPDPTWINPAPTTPSVILDPFGGTGTTALAAKAAGRTGVTIDMSADYCRLAEWRTTDPGQLAAALQVDKPAPVAPDQLDLLEGLLA